MAAGKREHEQVEVLESWHKRLGNVLCNQEEQCSALYRPGLPSDMEVLDILHEVQVEGEHLIAVQCDGLREDGGAADSKKSTLICLALFNVNSTTSKRMGPMGEEAKVMK